jgi:hypothetical protein
VGSTGTRKSIIVSTSSSQAAWASSRARADSVVTVTSGEPGGPDWDATAVVFGIVAACLRRRSRTRRRAGTSSNAISRAARPTISRAVDDVPAGPPVSARGAPASSKARSWRGSLAGPADDDAPGTTALVEEDASGSVRSVSGAQSERLAPGTPPAGVASNGIQPKPSK